MMMPKLETPRGNARPLRFANTLVPGSRQPSVFNHERTKGRLALRLHLSITLALRACRSSVAVQAGGFRFWGLGFGQAPRAQAGGIAAGLPRASARTRRPRAETSTAEFVKRTRVDAARVRRQIRHS